MCDSSELSEESVYVAYMMRSVQAGNRFKLAESAKSG